MQEPEIASAGNGGVASSSADGGVAAIGDVNSAGNAGTAIGVGDTVGSVGVDGGTVANQTLLSVSANGGTAISDASGGDYNQLANPLRSARALLNSIRTDLASCRVYVFGGDESYLWFDTLRSVDGVDETAAALPHTGRISRQGWHWRGRGSFPRQGGLSLPVAGSWIATATRSVLMT